MTNDNVFRQKVLDAFLNFQNIQNERDKLGFLKYVKPLIREIPFYYPLPEEKSTHNWKKEGF